MYSSSASSQSPSTSGVQERVTYKTLLREYTERNKILDPLYHTRNEGLADQPKFISTVYINGMSYTSSNTFSHRRAAKIDASRIAYFAIMQKMKDEGIHLVREGRILCKPILSEYAKKMKLEKPLYRTAQVEMEKPQNRTAQVENSFFRSFLVFNDVLYPGGIGKNRKEAEQLAARLVVLSILDSEVENVMAEIVTSQIKLHADLESTNSQTSKMPMKQTGYNLDQVKEGEIDVGTDEKPTTEAQSSSTKEYGLLHAYRHILDENADMMTNLRIG